MFLLYTGSAAAGVTAGQLTGTPAAGNHHLATQPGLNYAAAQVWGLDICILGGQTCTY